MNGFKVATGCNLLSTDDVQSDAITLTADMVAEFFGKDKAYLMKTFLMWKHKCKQRESVAQTFQNGERKQRKGRRSAKKI